MSDEIPIKIKQKSKKKPFILDKIKSTKDFVEDTATIIFPQKEESSLPQKGYAESLEYIRKNRKSKIEFPVDSKSKEKISKF